jgi:hypothetical protein
MASQRVFLSLAIAIGTIAALETGASAQQHRGTMEQQMACTPDVWRLCGEAIPDTDRIVACLRANTPQLSPGCRAVFETGNRAERDTRDRGRAARQQRQYDERPQYEAGPPPRPQQYPPQYQHQYDDND